MKRIDITTAQNVSIEYKAASVYDRILAWLIDVIIIIFSILILYLVISVVFPVSIRNAASIILISPIVFLYHLFFELFNKGSSPGKMTFNLRVIKINSEPVGVYDYLMRWVFRIVDILSSLGILAVITIASSPRNQRIGDFLADTTVIKVLKSERFSLNRILQLENLKDYSPVYASVVKLSEEDMLTLKEVVDRNNKFPGAGSNKVLEVALNQLELVLGIKFNNRSIETLKTLIKDYVALTR